MCRGRESRKSMRIACSSNLMMFESQSPASVTGCGIDIGPRKLRGRNGDIVARLRITDCRVDLSAVVAQSVLRIRKNTSGRSCRTSIGWSREGALSPGYNLLRRDGQRVRSGLSGEILHAYKVRVRVWRHPPHLQTRRHLFQATPQIVRQVRSAREIQPQAAWP